jgi:hypothetical protein
MLVCFTSAAPQRRQISVEIVEAAGAAVDIVSDAGFLLLVDAPAAANAIVDALLGEILHEAASASGIFDGGIAYMVSVDEPASATDSFAGFYAAGIFADVIEATTADSVEDATVIGALVPKSAMLLDVFVNSDGTLREANVNGTMVNL